VPSAPHVAKPLPRRKEASFSSIGVDVDVGVGVGVGVG
jgi:hypothetical protein